MRRVLGGLATLVALVGGLLLLGDPGGSEDPSAPEVIEPFEDLAGPLPEYVPPAPPPPSAPEPAKPQTEPRLEGRREGFLLVHVVDPDGAPVPRAWVHLEVGKGEDWREHTEETKDGVAKIPAPDPSERMHVEVTHPRDADGRALNLLKRRLEDLAVDAAEIVVALERARTLRGRAVNEEGAPVEGVKVVASDPKRFSTAQQVQTEADGTFVLPALPAGPLEVRIRLQDDTLLPVRDFVHPADEAELEIVLYRRMELVVLVLDDGGGPVRGAHVSVLWDWEQRTRGHQGRTDEEGRFVLAEACSKARYDVHVSTASSTPPVASTVIQGVGYGDGRIVIRAGPAASIRGEVVNEEGAIVPYGSVTVLGVGGENRGSRHTVPFEGGRFVVDRLAPGPYDVKALPRSLGYAPGVPVRVTAPADDVRLVVEPSVTVRGTVTGRQSKEVFVRWYSPRARLWTAEKVRPDGSFSLGGMPDEKGSVYANDHLGGTCGLLENVRPSEGPFEVALGPGGEIAGRVEGYRYDRGGVEIHYVRGPVRLRTHLIRDRTFRMTRVPAGRWRIELVRPARGGEVVDAVEGVEPGASDVVLRYPD